MIKIQFEQLVEDYYYDRLDAESRAAFETRIVLDSMFADQVERYIHDLEVMRDYRNMQLKTRFEAKENRIRRHAIVVKFARFAALILLTLAIPFTFMQYVFAKKNLAYKKAAVHREVVVDNEWSSSEALVQWVIDVVARKNESSDSFDVLISNYKWDTMDFSALEDLCHYTVNRMSTPLPDVSPELTNRFIEVLDSDGEYITNLLAQMTEKIENQENANNN